MSIIKNLLKFAAKEKPKQSVITEENIGGVLLKYKKHHASKRIKITIQSEDSVLVTLPKRMAFKHAKDFAHSQLAWIKENTSKMPRMRYVQNPIEIKNLRKSAKEYLPKRLDELAKMHGFKYRRVFIKNMRTRWGSCSFFNNINLNLNLMKLEDGLIDYVLLHELCHTVEKNHSNSFWNLLEKHLPEAKSLRKHLKNVNMH